MKLKFCGIRRPEDVAYCNKLLPNYMGMILTTGFRRTISPETASELVKKMDSRISAVGVFVDVPVSEIVQILKTVPLDVIQLHGKPDAQQIALTRQATGLPVWQAVRVQSEAEIRLAEQLEADQLVLEGYVAGQVGGTGLTADWNLIARAKPKVPFLLAGGIKPENLRQAIALVQPDGVDLSSGIETNGVKALEKMEEIATIIRGENHG